MNYADTVEELREIYADDYDNRHEQIVPKLTELWLRQGCPQPELWNAAIAEAMGLNMEFR